jgi:anaerobic ribonucleoside-triphosphate reductase
MSEKKGATVRVPTEIYSRVVGYYRPVQNWNEGKKQEFKEREYYDISFMDVPAADSSVA